MAFDQDSTNNKLLRLLSPRAYAKISVHLEAISLPHHHKIAVPRTVPSRVVFPNTGVISVINVIDEIYQETGLFGSDGAACLSTMLSAKPISHLLVVQIPGNGHQIRSATLKSVFDSDEEVRELLLCFIQSYISQVSHTSIANVQCNIMQRMARWLLMIQDRVPTACLPLTHEYMALTLGISRTSVTLSLKELEATGAISTGRKLVRIANRNRLLELAAKHYGRSEIEYDQIMAARVHANKGGIPASPSNSV